MAMTLIKGPSVEELSALLGEIKAEMMGEADLKGMLVRHAPDNCPWCVFTEPLRNTEQWQDFVVECLAQIHPLLVLLASVDGGTTQSLHEVMATCLYIGIRLGRKQAIKMPGESDAS